MIPKIIHQIWYQGWHEMPECYRYFAKHLQELHPDWEYRFWDESNLPPLINQEIHDKQEKPMFRSDIARFELLARYGGLYIDSDFLVLKNLDPLLENTDHILVETPRRVNFCACNGFLGMTPNHPLAWSMVKETPSRDREYPDAPRQAFSIPMLHDIVERTIPNPYILPAELFFPLSGNDWMNGLRGWSGLHYAVHVFNNRHNGENVEIHKQLPCYRREHGNT